MTSVIPVKDSPESPARSIIHYIDRIKNTKIDRDGLDRLKTLIQNLVDLCNAKFLHEFPIELAEISIDDADIGIRNSYHPDLKLSEMGNLMTENLEKAERSYDQTLYIDALCVLVSYCNILIFSRFDYGLEIKEKRLDICEPSNQPVYDQSSNHSVNGNDNHRQRRFSLRRNVTVHIPNRLLKEAHACDINLRREDHSHDVIDSGFLTSRGPI